MVLPHPPFWLTRAMTRVVVRDRACPPAGRWPSASGALPERALRSTQATPHLLRRRRAAGRTALPVSGCVRLRQRARQRDRLLRRADASLEPRVVDRPEDLTDPRARRHAEREQVVPRDVPRGRRRAAISACLARTHSYVDRSPWLAAQSARCSSTSSGNSGSSSKRRRRASRIRGTSLKIMCWRTSAVTRSISRRGETAGAPSRPARASAPTSSCRLNRMRSARTSVDGFPTSCSSVAIASATGRRAQVLQHEPGVLEHVALRVELLGLRHADFRRDLGQHHVEDAGVVEQREPARGIRPGHDPHQLVADPLGADRPEARRPCGAAPRAVSGAITKPSSAAWRTARSIRSPSSANRARRVADRAHARAPRDRPARRRSPAPRGSRDPRTAR